MDHYAHGQRDALALFKTGEILGHIAGPSGAGKTTLLRRLQTRHPQLVTQDLDDFHFQVRGKNKITDWDAHHQKVRAVLRRFVKQHRSAPVVLGGAHVPPEVLGDNAQRWMLDTSPLVSTWRRYRRKNQWPEVGPVGERLGNLTDTPRNYLNARHDVQTFKDEGYALVDTTTIENAIKKILATRG